MTELEKKLRRQLGDEEFEKVTNKLLAQSRKNMEYMMTRAMYREIAGLPPATPEERERELNNFLSNEENNPEDV